MCKTIHCSFNARMLPKNVNGKAATQDYNVFKLTTHFRFNQLNFWKVNPLFRLRTTQQKMRTHTNLRELFFSEL